MKTRTSILIETDILRKAQQIGLNISQTCENALTIYIHHLTNANTQLPWFGRQTHNLENTKWGISA